MEKEVLTDMERNTWISKETVRRITTPVPLVEIGDDRRVLIEHHRGVCSYSEEQVTVRVRYGAVCVKGSRLCIARMTNDQLVICGSIKCVDLIRSGGCHER